MFDNLKRVFPEFKAEFTIIESWNIEIFNPRELKHLAGVTEENAFRILWVIGLIEDDGEAVSEWRGIDKEGNLMPGIYNDIKDVPSEAYDVTCTSRFLKGK